eukprot:9386545-Lingulodinium_polyedra.AAC.1
MPSGRAATGMEGAPWHDRGARAQRAGGCRGDVDRTARGGNRDSPADATGTVSDHRGCGVSE